MSRKLRTILVLVAVVVAARVALPEVVQWYVNRSLDRAEGYTARIGDVDMALIRGAYTIHDVRIVKVGGDVPVPLLRVPVVDLSVEWGAIWHGALVGEVELRSPVLNFVAGPDDANTQTGASVDWRERVDALFPLRINRFVVEDGTVHFRNFHSDPPVDLYAQKIHLAAKNLTNVRDETGERVSSVTAAGHVLVTGRFDLNFELDPFAKLADFSFEGELRDVELVRTNDFLRAYANLDAERGEFMTLADIRCDDGSMSGYVKAFVDDLDVVRWRKDLEQGGLLQTTWEAITGAIGEIFQDQGRDRLAARIPIEGTIGQPDPDVWATAFSVVRNAFIEAIRARFDRNRSS